MAVKYKIFVSSVQKELAEERRGIKDFLTKDPLLSRFIEKVFLFEDIPAGNQNPDEIYLTEVEKCDIYIGVFGNQYGWKNDEGKSPTELEFDHATKTSRERLIFVKGNDDSKREPEMKALIKKAGEQLTRRRFLDETALLSEIYASLVEFLEKKGALRTTPFDDTICDGAAVDDIDAGQVAEFIKQAKAKGRLTLKGSHSTEAVLQNFNLIRDGKPVNAAILLFGKEPQRFFNNAQLHCFHFFGTEKRKPIASQQPYEGRLFDVIDKAEEFVLGKIDRHVGDRSAGSRAPVEFEIPREAISEAIVNAVAHRDYRSKGFVQVFVFSDRVEVWNPGALPPGLTPELLKAPHGSLPHNPLIAEPLFRTQYIEKAGTGTTDMIADCLDAGLPEPNFEQRGPHFVVTIWRDWLTEEMINKLDLSERLAKAVVIIKKSGRSTNSEYQAAFKVSRITATRDLDALCQKAILQKVGTTGKGTYYQFARKRITNASKES
jgi:predicted HTH transcriptional regulator